MFSPGIIAIVAANFTASLTNAEPFRLKVSEAGAVQEITVRGSGFENTGHPDRDQYMHWQIRRDDGPWQTCTGSASTPGATCRGTGWTNNSQTLAIGGDYVRREGFIELRVYQGLDDANATDPHKAPTPTEWSNIIRVPVVVPGGPPVIVSLSTREFPIGASADAYRFFIDANAIDQTTAVVFRGDVVVYPERILDGTRVQVSVPEVYRAKSPGELPIALRTDRGGVSSETYIRFVSPSAKVAPATRTNIPSSGLGRVITPATGAAVTRVAACKTGFVWRGATPDDRACVTPQSRDLTARQNATAASRRANSSDECIAGYVWREAVSGDKVCVTPAERTQAAEDTRLAPSRTAQ